MKKTYAFVISLALATSACMAFSGCGSTDTDSSTDVKASDSSTTVTEQQETDSEYVEQLNAEQPTESQSESTEQETSGWERVSDNEIKSLDGKLGQSFTYTVDNDTNTFEVTVVTTNYSDEDIAYLSNPLPSINLYTDLTPSDLRESGDSGLADTTYPVYKAGESTAKTFTGSLEDGWSTATLEVKLGIIVPDDAPVYYNVTKDQTEFNVEIIKD
jgi:hypothetical protein